MDDIRYRVWCRNNNEWEKDEMFLAEDGSLYHVLRNGRLQRCRPDTHTVQFFTGLRDSKRTEDFPDGEPIYEGDVVLDIHSNKRRIVLAVPGGFSVHTFDDLDPRFYEGISDMQNSSWISGSCVVIGNRFENPELLEGGM